jgi:hypothetical protein
MPLEIIGAGFGRTGTHSLKLALEALGFAKCYHMDELINDHPDHVRYWKDVLDGKPGNWDVLFSGYRAAVDAPVFLCYRELMTRYPEAKVILTLRNAESWYKSFGDTIIKASRPSAYQMILTGSRMLFSKTLRERIGVLKFASETLLPRFFPNGFEDKASAIRFYEDWNRSVMETVPKEKLLVFEVKQGWDPLCSFLGVPVPSIPFPHSNTTAEFLARKF